MKINLPPKHLIELDAMYNALMDLLQSDYHNEVANVLDTYEIDLSDIRRYIDKLKKEGDFI